MYTKLSGKEDFMHVYSKPESSMKHGKQVEDFSCSKIWLFHVSFEVSYVFQMSHLCVCMRTSENEKTCPVESHCVFKYATGEL